MFDTWFFLYKVCAYTIPLGSDFIHIWLERFLDLFWKLVYCSNILALTCVTYFPSCRAYCHLFIMSMYHTVTGRSRRAAHQVDSFFKEYGTLWPKPPNTCRLNLVMTWTKTGRIWRMSKGTLWPNTGNLKFNQLKQKRDYMNCICTSVKNSIGITRFYTH